MVAVDRAIQDSHRPGELLGLPRYENELFSVDLDVKAVLLDVDVDQVKRPDPHFRFAHNERERVGDDLDSDPDRLGRVVGQPHFSLK